MARIASCDRRPLLQGDQPEHAAGGLHQGDATGQPVVRLREEVPAAGDAAAGRADREPGRRCRRCTASCAPRRSSRRWSASPSRRRSSTARSSRSWPTGSTAWAGRSPSPATRAPTRRARATGTATGPAPTCTSSSGSRSSPGRCAPPRARTSRMTAELRDGKIKVIVDARDDNNKPIIDLDLRGKMTTPTGKAEQEGRADLEFKQTNAGVYEAEVKADEMGLVLHQRPVVGARSRTRTARWSSARTASRSWRRRTASAPASRCRTRRSTPTWRRTRRCWRSCGR